MNKCKIMTLAAMAFCVFGPAQAADRNAKPITNTHLLSADTTKKEYKPGSVHITAPRSTLSVKKQPIIAPTSNKVLGGDIDVGPYIHTPPAHGAWHDVSGALDKMKQAMDQYEQAYQNYARKLRSCIPRNRRLTLQQQHYGLCIRNSTVEKCYKDYISRCTQSERTAMNNAKISLCQASAILKGKMRNQFNAYQCRN